MPVFSVCSCLCGKAGLAAERRFRYNQQKKRNGENRADCVESRKRGAGRAACGGISGNAAKLQGNCFQAGLPGRTDRNYRSIWTRDFQPLPRWRAACLPDMWFAGWTAGTSGWSRSTSGTKTGGGGLPRRCLKRRRRSRPPAAATPCSIACPPNNRGVILFLRRRLYGAESH